MVRVALCLALFTTTASAAALKKSAPQCLALEVPQTDTNVAVVGTYEGQRLEFRVTVDGRPINLETPTSIPIATLACAPTS